MEAEIGRSSCTPRAYVVSTKSPLSKLTFDESFSLRNARFWRVHRAHVIILIITLHISFNYMYMDFI